MQPDSLVTGDSSEGVKRLGHEADWSPSTTECKNSWSYTYNPQYVFIAWRLIKHTGNFTFSVVYFLFLCFASSDYSLYAMCKGNYVYEWLTTVKVMWLLPVATVETLSGVPVNYIRLVLTASFLVLRESTSIPPRILNLSTNRILVSHSCGYGM
jgi:hypothetical protein